MSRPAAVVRVAGRALARSRGGHPWIWADDVVDARAAAHGDLVTIADPSGRTVGHGWYSARSKIRLRVVRISEEPPDAAFWAGRMQQAASHRRRVVDRDTNAYRVLFAESDGVPGLVADLYGRHLVVQAATAATERSLGALLDALRESGVEFDSVLARNDSAVRELEGLPREVRQIEGATPRSIEVREHGLRFEVDPWTGQKTGAFLDQRDNRAAAARACRGDVLDAFAYHGWFAVQVAEAADSVVVLESSAEALARARTNAERNACRNVSFVEANAFDALRDLERSGRRFDAILLDPPAFARSKRDLAAARRGYREINLRAMRLLKDDGILMTSSCSYNLTEPDFLDLVAVAAAGADRSFRLDDRRTQAGDHPIRLGFPESHYLKCLVLRNQPN